MSYFFLLLLTLGLYSASSKINQYIFNEKENIIINTFTFSFFFGLIYLISSYLFILNISGRYFTYLFLAVITIISLLQIKEIYNYFKIFKSNYISNNRIVLTILLFYFFTILLPVADEDSLRYHLEVAKKINNGSFYINTWFDYITLGAHEFINSFALHINFEHISSYSNFVYLSFAIFANIYILKKYKEGSGILSGIILLSCPYLLALISSQKFYFFPCFIVSYSIAYLYLEKKINTITIYLILLLNIFCVTIKPIFAPYLILVGIWLLIINKGYKNKIFYLLSAIVLFIIFHFPIFFIKQKIYNDPFIPYISINSENFVWLSDYKTYLTGFNMDLTDDIENLLLKYLLIPIKLIVPLKFADIFKTLGLALLFLFSFNYKKNKYLFSLLLFFIFAVVILNNYQTRWFLPLLIFISIFARIDKLIILKKITFLQLFGVSCILVPMSLVTLASNIGLLDKKIILDRIFQSHKMIEIINTKYKNEKIFSKINYFYYFDNIVPIYYPIIVKKFDNDYYKNNEKTTKLILWPGENEKPLKPDISKNKIFGQSIFKFVDENFTCKNLVQIDEFSVGVGRNFLLHNKKRTKIRLYKLDC